ARDPLKDPSKVGFRPQLQTFLLRYKGILSQEVTYISGQCIMLLCYYLIVILLCFLHVIVMLLLFCCLFFFTLHR
ncbi:hypothetical protein L9F63_002201, partial [Diploptera punctata]